MRIKELKVILEKVFEIYCEETTISEYTDNERPKKHIISFIINK